MLSAIKDKINYLFFPKEEKPNNPIKLALICSIALKILSIVAVVYSSIEIAAGLFTISFVADLIGFTNLCEEIDTELDATIKKLDSNCKKSRRTAFLIKIFISGIIFTAGITCFSIINSLTLKNQFSDIKF